MIPRLVRLNLSDCCVAGARAATRAGTGGVAAARVRAAAGACADGVAGAGAAAGADAVQRGG